MSTSVLRCRRCTWKVDVPPEEDALVRAVAVLEKHLYEVHALTFRRASQEVSDWLEHELTELISKKDGNKDRNDDS